MSKLELGKGKQTVDRGRKAEVSCQRTEDWKIRRSEGETKEEDGKGRNRKGKTEIRKWALGKRQKIRRSECEKVG